MAEALICPTCSAPLQYPASGGASMQCPYCKTTVLLSAQPQSAGISDDMVDPELRPLIEEARKMIQASGGAGQLNKIEAIRMFRAASGASLADAKKAIESAAPRTPYAGIRSGSGPNQMRVTPSGSKGAGVIAFFGLLIGALAVAFTLMRHQQVQPPKPAWVPTIPLPSIIAPTLPGAAQAPGFANMTLEFGSEGIGPGRFKDARSIGLDGQGRIYVGEYSNGRIQMFDRSGKYVSEFSIGQNKSMLNLFADMAGIVYVVVPGHIYKFLGESGTPLPEMANSSDDGQVYYMDACLGPAGVVYAIAGNSDIVKLSATTGQIQSTFKAQEKVGEDVYLSRIAVMGTGEILALDHQKGVFKFASDGRYINRFGGGEDTTGPSHLMTGDNIAVDGQGRIYVSDLEPCIKVFSSSGSYIDGFGGNGVCFGLAINDKDEIFGCFRNDHAVRKFALSSH